MKFLNIKRQLGVSPKLLPHVTMWALVYVYKWPVYYCCRSCIDSRSNAISLIYYNNHDAGESHLLVMTEVRNEAKRLISSLPSVIVMICSDVLNDAGKLSLMAKQGRWCRMWHNFSEEDYVQNAMSQFWVQLICYYRFVIYFKYGCLGNCL